MSRDKEQHIRVYRILTVLWIGMIFWNSLHNGTESSESSSLILAWLQKLPLLSALSEFLVRKAAHVTEFAVLGLLIAGSLSRRAMAQPLFLALLTAVSDETIQLFIEGRSGSVRDVWIDFAGALVGVFLYWLCAWRKPQQPQHRETGWRLFLPFLLVICCMAFIWGQSLQDAQTSNAVSGAVLQNVQKMISSSIGQKVTLSNLLVRKSAHFIEFFVLGIFLCLLFRPMAPGTLWKRLLLGLLLPCGDEALQLIVDGRSSRVADVWIDFGGAVCGMFIIAVIWRLCKRRIHYET